MGGLSGHCLRLDVFFHSSGSQAGLLGVHPVNNVPPAPLPLKWGFRKNLRGGGRGGLRWRDSNTWWRMIFSPSVGNNMTSTKTWRQHQFSHCPSAAQLPQCQSLVPSAIPIMDDKTGPSHLRCPCADLWPALPQYCWGADVRAPVHHAIWWNTQGLLSGLVLRYLSLSHSVIVIFISSRPSMTALWSQGEGVVAYTKYLKYQKQRHAL